MYTSCCQELAAPGNPARIPALKFTTESWLGLRAPRSAPSSFPLWPTGTPHFTQRGGFCFSGDLETTRKEVLLPAHPPRSAQSPDRPRLSAQATEGTGASPKPRRWILSSGLWRGAARPANPERPFRHENLQFQSFPETLSPPPPTPPEAPRSPRHRSIAFLPIQSPEVHF